MKFSESWLREWVNPNIDTQTLASQLTMAGLEVDGIETASPSLDGVVIGKVTAIKPHSNADKLSVCQVDIQSKEPLQIVCGAQNVAEGVKIPVATIGTKLSPDFIIKPVKLRGVDSHGMLCSAKELGLGESGEGLMILPHDAPIGASITDYLSLDDHIICLDLTPNRADCLSILGLARETAALNNQAFEYPTFPAVATSNKKDFSISVDCPERCPRYATRIISNLPKTSVSPIWLQEKLRRSGIRSLHPIVDITNFVMLELGQPMHAFDLDKLSGSTICVHLAKTNETISLLNQQQLTLNPNTLVIADAEKPIALAGVMGGDQTAVTDATQSIVLESAYFNPTHLSGCARSYGLHTDSSHRFERGVDYALIEQALERATQLILEMVGGTAHEITRAESTEHLPKTPVIHLENAKISQVLGITIAPERVEAILKSLGLSLRQQNDAWQVTVPSHRSDITTNVDLIEEIARIYGYDNIPNQPIVSASKLMPCLEQGVKPEKLRQLLTAWGYNEAITYSFIDPKLSELLHPGLATPTLKNPIASDMSAMRPSLWPGLLLSLKYNRSHQIDRIKLFEMGNCFAILNGKTVEDNRLAGVIVGSKYPENWANPKQPLDFFDIKNDCKKLLKSMGRIGECKMIPSQHSALHPSESAAILLDNIQLGSLGKLNPKICQTLDLPNNIFLFELTLDHVNAAILPKLQPLSPYPAVRRDIAMTLPRDIPVNQVIEHIKKQGKPLLTNCVLFDLYQGEKIADTEKSIAIGLILQSHEHTLKDEEIKQLVDNIVLSLKTTFNAELRG